MKQVPCGPEGGDNKGYVIDVPTAALKMLVPVLKFGVLFLKLGLASLGLGGVVPDISGLLPDDRDDTFYNQMMADLNKHVDHGDVQDILRSTEEAT